MLNSLQESGSCRGCVWKQAVTMVGGRRKALCSAAPNNAFIYPTVPRPPRRGVPAPLRDDSAPPGRQKETRSGSALQRAATKVGDRFISSRFPTRSGGKQSGSSRSGARARARGGRSRTGEAARRTSGYNLQNKSSALASSDFKSEIKKHPSCRAPV